MGSFRKKASSRGWVRSGPRVSLRLSTARAPFSRAHLDRIELPADWRDLLVRSRATASRAELVSARPFSAAAIWYGSSPGAERQVLWGLRLNSNRRSHGDTDWVLSARLLGVAGVALWKPRHLINPWAEHLRRRTLKYSPRVAKGKFRRRIFRDLMLSRIDYADWSG